MIERLTCKSWPSCSTSFLSLQVSFSATFSCFSAVTLSLSCFTRGLDATIFWPYSINWSNLQWVKWSEVRWDPENQEYFQIYRSVPDSVQIARERFHNACKRECWNRDTNSLKLHKKTKPITNYECFAETSHNFSSWRGCRRLAPHLVRLHEIRR